MVLCWQEKLSLMDTSEIIAFLAQFNCGCKCHCSDKIRAMDQNDAVQVIRDLRTARMAGGHQYVSHRNSYYVSQTCLQWNITTARHPPGGVKGGGENSRPCFCQTSSLVGHAQGGFAEETLWVFRELNEFKISRPGKKTVFQYPLPLIGQICRSCWILYTGWSLYTKVIEFYIHFIEFYVRVIEFCA